MMYIGIYILIGMVFAGLQFSKIIKTGFTAEERQKLKSGEETDELKIKTVSVFISAVLISLFIVFLYPIFITALFAKKVSK